MSRSSALDIFNTSRPFSRISPPDIIRRRRRHQPRDGKRRDALAAAAFAHQADGFARVDVERHAIHRAQAGIAREEIEFQIFDFEQRHDRVLDAARPVSRDKSENRKPKSEGGARLIRGRRIRISDLFRISSFDLRILFPLNSACPNRTYEVFCTQSLCAGKLCLFSPSPRSWPVAAPFPTARARADRRGQSPGIHQPHR